MYCSEWWVSKNIESYFDTGLANSTFDTWVSLAATLSFLTWVAVVTFSPPAVNELKGENVCEDKSDWCIENTQVCVCVFLCLYECMCVLVQISLWGP